MQKFSILVNLRTEKGKEYKDMDFLIRISLSVLSSTVLCQCNAKAASSSFSKSRTQR